MFGIVRISTNHMWAFKVPLLVRVFVICFCVLVLELSSSLSPFDMSLAITKLESKIVSFEKTHIESIMLQSHSYTSRSVSSRWHFFIFVFLFCSFFVIVALWAKLLKFDFRFGEVSVWRNREPIANEMRWSEWRKSIHMSGLFTISFSIFTSHCWFCCIWTLYTQCENNISLLCELRNLVIEISSMLIIIVKFDLKIGWIFDSEWFNLLFP